MATLTVQTVISLVADHQKPDDFNNVLDPFSINILTELTSGTGAGQTNALFRDKRTVTTGANDDLDLAGTLTNAFGEVLTFATIKGIIISAAAANTTNLTIGLGTNPFVSWLGGTTPTLGPIVPGGVFFLSRPDDTGYAVTAGTADILRITNAAGASAIYDIVLYGEV